MKKTTGVKVTEKKLSIKNKDNKIEHNNKNELPRETNEEDEFNLSLAAMENEIKPRVLKTISSLEKNYNKLIKYQTEKLDAILNSQIFSISKEKSYKKIVNEIVVKIISFINYIE